MARSRRRSRHGETTAFKKTGPVRESWVCSWSGSGRRPARGVARARLDDQLQFYAEKMYDFNREIERDPSTKTWAANNWSTQATGGTADAAKLNAPSMVVYGQ